MLWGDRNESNNVIDNRGKRMMVGGGIGGLILFAIAAFLGIDPRQVTSSVSNTSTQVRQPSSAENRFAHFTKVILGDTETIWGEQFGRLGKRYRPPTMVLYDGAVDSACGRAGSSVGPFYCARDERLYIDLSFYKDMTNKLGASGDFAWAYVIAHEVGHHVQHLLGYLRETRSNRQSVRQELNADFLAGVWAHHAEEKFKFLENGDLEEALGAASAVGDDRLQQQSRGYVVPDSFTHGTSAQRAHWFRKGFDSGDLRQGRELYTAENLSE